MTSAFVSLFFVAPSFVGLGYGQGFLSERYEKIGETIEICQKLEELDQFSEENIHEVTLEEIKLCETALDKDLDGIDN
ncbi:MAG: hypothetical protein ACPKPY_05345 [Nitrososphaeraceae archaeon]